MSAPQDLTGLVTEVRQFLRELAADNTRAWFQANKGQYDAVLKRPALMLMDGLTPELERLSGMPVKPKLFRPHRDVRFSEDKTPYHTHMHILWSCADGRGWYFGLAGEYATAGAGIMAFDEAQLDTYREAVAGEEGEDLAARLARIGGRMDPPALKRVPQPYPSDHPRGELLRRKGLVIWRDNLEPVLERDASAGLAEVFAELSPVQDWLDGL